MTSTPASESTTVAGILHADLDCFYAAVEIRDRSELRGRPVIVGSGVVLTASYEARAMGVRTAMPTNRARALCPDAVVLPGRMEVYSEASRQVFDVFHDTTPLVEGLSIDEAFLDVRGLERLAGPAATVAADLRRRVLAEVGLPITVGVARTKFLAKVASGVAKPDGLLVVEPDRELAFLHPLDVSRVWGVGPVTAAALRDKGIHTVGQLADLDEQVLTSLVGPAAGRHLHDLANNRDRRAVVTGRRRSSIGSQRALGRRRTSKQFLDTAVIGLVERVTERLRRGHRVGRTVTLRLRMDDFTRQTRSRTLTAATDRTDVVLGVASDLLDERWAHLREAGCTLIGITISDLAPADAVQLALDFDGHDRSAIDVTVDAVRARWGAGALGRAGLVGIGAGSTVPLLPDPGAPSAGRARPGEGR